MFLPDFIQTAIDTGNTSVGMNGAFCGDYINITNKLLSDRYSQVISSVSKIYGYIPTIDEAKTKLSKLVVKTMEIEKPLREQLQNLCEATVNKTLGVPQETILLDCKLVDKVHPDVELRIMPEEPEYNFCDVVLPYNDAILKRRLINSMVQGISYLLMTATYDNEKIHEWNGELVGLYGEIIALNDYLLFSVEETITDDNPMLGAYVETNIGKQDEKTVIDAQGLIYPFLLQETYRGFFEMFATSALPDDLADAMAIMRKADITIAEAWDLRIGVPIWQTIDKLIDDNVESSIYPYIFSSIIIDKDFNDTMYKCFNKDKDVIEWLGFVINQVKHDREYQLFKNDIERFNLEKCLITEE